MNDTDKLIKEIAKALPASSFEELTNLVNLKRKRPVSVSTVSTAVAKLRRMATIDPGIYRWTIPHIKRGRNPNEANKRLIAVLRDRKGDFFTTEDNREKNVKEGRNSTIRSTSQQLFNLSVSLRISIPYYTSLQMRMYLEGIALDIDHAHIKLDSVIMAEKKAEKQIFDEWIDGRGA